MPPQISLSNLYEIKNKRDNYKNKTFDEIIKKCHEKIKSIAHQGGMNTFYEVPFVVIGKPLYKINDCVEYVIKALQKNGLLVRLIEINMIYISWNPVDINKRKLIK